MRCAVTNMTTTVALSRESHRELTILKVEEGYRSMDELVHELVREHRRNKLLHASGMVRSRMDELDVSLSDLIDC